MASEQNDNPMDMLAFLVEFQIIRKLNGNSIIAHHLYRIIYSTSEIKILERTP